MKLNGTLRKVLTVFVIALASFGAGAGLWDVAMGQADYDAGYHAGYAAGESDQLDAVLEQIEDIKQEAYDEGYEEAMLVSAENSGGENKLPIYMKPSVVESSTGEDYVLNTNSMKFHYPWCSSAERILDWNREDVTCDREELIDQGYSPCKRCCP